MPGEHGRRFCKSTPGTYLRKVQMLESMALGSENDDKERWSKMQIPTGIEPGPAIKKLVTVL